MELDKWIDTPRFLKVKISAIFARSDDSAECGYTEPTHYDSPDWDIRGKHIGTNRMVFAAIRKGGQP